MIELSDQDRGEIRRLMGEIDNVLAKQRRQMRAARELLQRIRHKLEGREVAP